MLILDGAVRDVTGFVKLAYGPHEPPTWLKEMFVNGDTNDFREARQRFAPVQYLSPWEEGIDDEEFLIRCEIIVDQFGLAPPNIVNVIMDLKIIRAGGDRSLIIQNFCGYRKDR